MKIFLLPSSFFCAVSVKNCYFYFSNIFPFSLKIYKKKLHISVKKIKHFKLKLKTCHKQILNDGKKSVKLRKSSQYNFMLKLEAKRSNFIKIIFFHQTFSFCKEIKLKLSKLFKIKINHSEKSFY